MIGSYIIFRPLDKNGQQTTPLRCGLIKDKVFAFLSEKYVVEEYGTGFVFQVASSQIVKTTSLTEIEQNKQHLLK